MLKSWSTYTLLTSRLEMKWYGLVSHTGSFLAGLKPFFLRNTVLVCHRAHAGHNAYLIDSKNFCNSAVTESMIINSYQLKTI